MNLHCFVEPGIFLKRFVAFFMHKFSFWIKVSEICCLIVMNTCRISRI